MKGSLQIQVQNLDHLGLVAGIIIVHEYRIRIRQKVWSVNTQRSP
jgi:hypothetical protein